jgi:hypothetical protein
LKDPTLSDAPSFDTGKKTQLVRDSFTIPQAEYAAIDALKARALKLGVGIKKSELLRAGLMVLQQLSDARFQFAIRAVPTIKTGRPTSLQVSASFTPAAVGRTTSGEKTVTVSAASPKTIVKKVPLKAPSPAPAAPAAKAGPRVTVRSGATATRTAPTVQARVTPAAKATKPARKPATPT